ncbi:hypothetical protein CUS72_02850 [Enterococcus faecium]|uniref:hypothetical protein n=2 Tax=Enterococcus faecium TaxID=1352 RepID=UPI000CF2A2D9|nr:hypothetical protein [Enterococcus faecium]PQE78706.1 hypothetical protein CUS29_02145 [Enterococcus faecium]PQF78622.1 hypothetical protein CUS72_02850 [Enterococcus faecium]
MLFFLYLFGHTYVLSIPFFSNTMIAGIGSYNNKYLLLEVARQLNLAFLVFIFLSLWISKSKKNLYIQDTIMLIKKKIKPNILISIISFILCILFLMFVKTGNQNIGLVLILFEYYFLLVVLFYLFSKQTTTTCFLIHFLLVSSSLKTLLNNGRIEFIISMLLLFILFYEKKIHPIWIFSIFCLGLIFVESYGILRNGNDLSDLLNSKYFFDRNNPPAVIDSTEGYVIHSSMSMIGLIQDGYFSNSERIISFFKMLLLQFLPVGSLGNFSDASVTSYIQNFTTTLGGGLIFSQWYFWLNWKGILIISCIIKYIFQKAYLTKNIFTGAFCIMSLCFFPRWLSYFSDYLIKIPFQVVVLLLAFSLINKMTNKENVIGRMEEV